jgi:autotransporter-associated beta strand protein
MGRYTNGRAAWRRCPQITSAAAPAMVTERSYQLQHFAHDRGTCWLRRSLRAALLGSAALVPLNLSAAAQDATWLSNPGTNDFNTGSNWSPATVPTSTAFFGTSGTTSLSFSTDTTIGGWTFNAGASNYRFDNGQTLTFTAGGIAVNGGSVTLINNGLLNLSNASTFGSATVSNFGIIFFNDSSSAGNAGLINSGSLSFSGSSTAGSGSVLNTFARFIMFSDSSSAGSAGITNNRSLNFANTSTAGSATIKNSFDGIVSFIDSSTAGSAHIVNDTVVTFSNSSTAGNSTITNNRTLIFFDTSTADGATVTNGGSLRFVGSGTAGSATITNNNGATTTMVNSGSGGTARFIFNGTGALDLSGLATGGTTAGSIEGAGAIFLGSKNLAVGGNNLSTSFSGVLQDGGSPGGTGGSLTKVGSGTLTLGGTNTYTGNTLVSAGTLEVDGSIANSASVTVNAGATLSGTGIVDPATTTVMSGGTLAPGNASTPTGTLRIGGNLAFQSGALYLVQLTPAAASSTVIAGSATLAGATVQAIFAPGAYVAKSYDILHAAGSLGGTTFAGLSTVGAPANFVSSLRYTPTDVFLNLTATLGGGTGLIGQQQNVAGAINNFFNNGGMLPPGVAALFNLTGSDLANALTLASGEAATGAQQSAFQLGGQFLNAMLDPFVDGRGGIAGGAGRDAGSGFGFAPERQGLPDDVALAYAKAMKAPTMSNAPPLPVIGSHDLTARAGGFAGGFDYHLTRDAVVGFALAGGATSWSIASGAGGGRSDAAQAGVYAATRSGPAYLAGSLSFTNHWVSTDRFAAFADHLTASFEAQSFGGRIEGGYRFAVANAGVTPYAAAQAQSFRTPAYSEADLFRRRLCPRLWRTDRHRCPRRARRALRPGGAGLARYTAHLPWPACLGA